MDFDEKTKKVAEKYHPSEISVAVLRSGNNYYQRAGSAEGFRTMMGGYLNHHTDLELLAVYPNVNTAAVTKINQAVTSLGKGKFVNLDALLLA